MKIFNFLIFIYPKAGKYAALALLFLFTGFLANGQLKAGFNASPQTGCAPLVVQFTDSSTGNPSSWKWDLGNGTTSVLENPSAAYFDPGTYTVKLTIQNSFGIDSVTKVQYITVYSSPVINFTASAQTGCFPLNTRFSDLSFPGSGLVSKWQWDFGDGNFSDAQNPDHTYTSTGDFNVSLRATNNFGCVTFKTVPSFIHIETGVKADFSNSVSKTCSAPATISFINKSSGVGTLAYQWDFGDGNSSLLANPTHTYDSPGSFTVTLIVTNSTGCTDTLRKTHLITIGTTTADFSIPFLACAENPLIFNNTSTPVPPAASWDFGDGTFSGSVDPVKVYKNPGNYTIKMVTNNGACKDSVTKTIDVLAKPVVSFSAADTVSCAAPFNVGFMNSSKGTGSSFTNTASSATTFDWDFGDGSHSNLENPSHIYLHEGNYTVKLLVTSASGCSDSLVKTGYIRIKIPVVSLRNLPQKGCAPLSHTFAAEVNSVEPVSLYHWDFGDGYSSNSVNPTHVYNTPGKYPVILTYTTRGGCTDSVMVQDAIIVGSKPVASYTADPLNVCARQKINFTDQTGGRPDEWLWFFGDGGSAITQNPDHQYNDTGYFDVTLIALNNGCADTITYHDKIHIHPPVARFTYVLTCADPRQVIFTDQSIGADYWNWDFGDGSTSAEKNPAHAYVNPGNYTVSLTVTNQITGCSETRTSEIRVIREVADFKVSDSETCRNTPVRFTATNSIQGHVALYTWRFGDGMSMSDSSSESVHQYAKASPFNVTLILKDINGCVDSVTKPLAVRVNGPTAVFHPAVSGTCLNNSVSFTDSSYTDGVHDIQQWSWNWGDGNTENLTAPPFHHIYSSPGNYPVSLAITDSKGCSDTMNNPQAVIISKPQAAFSSATVSCTRAPIVFSNTSTGPGLVYAWDFGDGNSSGLKDPVHLYPSEGTYPVTLTVHDQYGCSSSVSKPGYVKIADPVADFTISDSVGSCPPLVVRFSDHSLNNSSWSWDFGDGSSSAELNPSHFYSAAGTFTAVLTITGPGGCTSQKIKHIRVDGPSGSFSYTNRLGCNPLTTGFRASAKKNISFVWDFNDGNTVATEDSVITHTYITPGKYLPKMILKDASGCQVAVKGTDSISVFGVVASFQDNGALVCDARPVAFTSTSLTNDAIITYLWNFGDGTTSTDAHPFHAYSQPGLYNPSLKVTTQRGCRDSVDHADPVRVNRSPQISISGTAAACVPALIQFTGIVSNPDSSTVSWKWDFDNGNLSNGQKPGAQSFPLAGNYTVKAIGYSSNGCNDTASKAIEIDPLPDLHISADTVVCAGSAEVLPVSGAQTYSWSPATYLSCTSCANPVARPDSFVEYHVKGTSNKGCVSIDSISLAVKFPFRLSISSPDTLCSGRSVLLKAGGTEKYSWSPATGLNNNQVATPVASPAVSTIYQVIGSDSKGCFKDTGYVPVKVYPVPVVNAGEDRTINVGQDIQLVAQTSPDVTSVLWTPSAGIVSANDFSVTVRPIQSMEYTVEAKNAGGCTSEDKVSVYVLCNNANIFVPNTFSPNGDGSNEVFYPRGSGVFKILNLKVFNRWGQIVFENSNFNANDASAGWDGTCKGKSLPPDVFVYMLQVVCENNSTLTFKGNIALIR